MSHEPSLRERKQLRTREAILDAAMTLFAEHGFDGVTVNDIAARAEIGRTTFFRYFTDKQELLFADDDQIEHVMVAAVDTAATPHAPIGDSLAIAIDITRAGLLALTDVIVARAGWMPLRERLIAAHPALTARALVKEREYATIAVTRLIQHGATLETAALAVGVATACYQTAQVTTAANPEHLTTAANAAFARLKSELGRRR